MGKKRIANILLLILFIGAAFFAGRISAGSSKKKEEVFNEFGVESSDDNGKVDAEEARSDYEYEVLPDDTVMVTQYSGDEKIVFVPEKLDGKIISGIGDSAFRGNNAEQIILPQNVRTIGKYAFSYCPNLQYVIMGDEINAIGGHAFSYCPSLVELFIPEGMTKISVCICAYSPRLQKVTLPENMESICYQAFDHCDSLQFIYGDNACAEGYAKMKGLIYVDSREILLEDYTD